MAGRPNPLAHLRLGLTHSPEPRVLDSFADDGYDLVLAGHTRRRPVVFAVYGALVTNCHIDRSRVKGPSNWGSTMKLHECWNRDVAVCSGPVLLPSGGKLVDADPGLTRRRRFRRSVLLAACDGRQSARQTLVVQRTVSILRATTKETPAVQPTFLTPAGETTKETPAVRPTVLIPEGDATKERASRRSGDDNPHVVTTSNPPPQGSEGRKRRRGVAVSAPRTMTSIVDQVCTGTGPPFS